MRLLLVATYNVLHISTSHYCDMTLSVGSKPTLHQANKPLSSVAARFLARARKEYACGDFNSAEQSLANVLALAPNNTYALQTLAMMMVRVGDHARAADYYQRLLTVCPDDADLHIELGIALNEQGKIDAAITHLRLACDLAPDSPAACFTLGTLLERNGQADLAITALRRVLELDPVHIQSYLWLARAHAGLGQIDCAEKEFRQALSYDSSNAEGWFGLSNLNTVRFDSKDLATLQGAFANKNLAVREYELIGFALAKALEDKGDFAKAFDTFGLINASRRKHADWNSARGRKRVNAIMQAFSSEMPPPTEPQLGHQAIFVASIPRSGSNLVEQILASHPGVEGANEIMDLPQVIDGESQRRGMEFPQWIPQASAADWHRLGQAYLARTERWHSNKPRFTDKSLVNWYLAGTALAMLPGAKVVVVRRDPVETCLGCYRQCFDAANGFGSDLYETADYCIDFVRLTRLWLEKYPDRVYDLQYEVLVADPEAEIRRLLAFCGLPFDPACLAFHETARTVRSSPSVAQVRQALRRDTARSLHYGSKLDGLRQHLRNGGVLVEE
ncbi:MAG: sulfotransferase [Xanthomonadales bacterium]|nr:sulfotransferase [Xanthomonadales bacterium]